MDLLLVSFNENDQEQDRDKAIEKLMFQRNWGAEREAAVIHCAFHFDDLDTGRRGASYSMEDLDAQK